MFGNEGYIELSKGEYVGELTVEGVNISPIVGLFFKDNGVQWLWIKRKRQLEYDIESGEYRTKKPRPTFDAYLKKQPNNNVAYKGEFVFFKFKYRIFALWAAENGQKKGRLNLFVERLEMKEQNIIKLINKRNNEKEQG